MPVTKLIIALAACLAATPPQSGEWRVMSFNIRYGTADDGANAWPLRRHLVVDVIRRGAPDILGLQEALRSQLDELRTALPGYGEAGVGRDDGRQAGEYAAILFRTDRFDLLASGTFWLSDTPEVPGSRSWGNNVTRIATWVRLRERAGDRTVTVYNVHLDHESQPSRERSVALLLERIRTRGNHDPVIVTGDFNAGEDNPAVSAMRSLFTDAFRDVHPGDTLVGTFNGFRGTANGAKIDHIFVSPGIAALEAAIDRSNEDGRYPSDHFPVTARVRLAAAAAPPVVAPEGEAMELEEMVVVTTARVERRVADEPLRVEVVDAEEIEEKAAMTPGDVAMLLNETGGLRVQSTAPGLGRGSVRVQGQLGRYTLVLADGLPLYGEAGALDVMQVPPMDLGRVEVIKGPGSALYGGPALAGVVNLVSRRPDGAREVLLNATSRGGFDAVGWVAGERTWSLLAGMHTQPRVDVDGDGWADVARYRRWVARPRLHLGEGTATSVYLTGGVTREERSGGTMDGDTVPAGIPWEDGLTTTRADIGASLRRVTGSGWLLAARGSAMQAKYERTLGPSVESSERRSGLVEATASRPGATVTWLVGAAVQLDRLAADSVPVFSYSYATPGVFGQAEWEMSDGFTVSASLRYDRHNRYGGYLSERVSALWRAGGPWTLRVSGGNGPFWPGPYLEETDAVGLRPFVGPLAVHRERGTGISADLGGVVGPIEVNATVFVAEVTEQVWADLPPSLPPGPGTPVHANALGPTRNGGVDLLARWRHGPLQLTTTYTYLDGTRDFAGQREIVPLNPQHAAGAVAMWERGPTRLGAELYYVGRQRLDDDPYRTQSADYVLAGVLVMQRVGRAQLFVNFENLGDVRQTRWAPLLRPSYDVRRGWTTDAWAPLEGRVVNAGVRWRF